MRISPESMVSRRLMVRHMVDLPEPESNHNDDLAAVDRQIDVVEDVQIAIVLIDVSELDQRLIAGGRGALCMVLGSL